MKVYLLRHGKTSWNNEGRYQGLSDIPLSQEGMSALRPADFSAKTVYVSPLLRARQTAAILFPDAVLKAEPGLQEMDFGVFEGRNAQEMEKDSAYRAWWAFCPGTRNRTMTFSHGRLRTAAGGFWKRQMEVCGFCSRFAAQRTERHADGIRRILRLCAGPAAG